MWETATTDDFDHWFEQLDEAIQEEVAASVKLLQVYGPMLKRPHADTLNDSKHANMKELRVDELGAVIRITFAFDPHRKAILLVAGDKSGVNQKRFYRQLIAKADRLYDEHLERLKRQRKGS